MILFFFLFTSRHTLKGTLKDAFWEGFSGVLLALQEGTRDNVGCVNTLSEQYTLPVGVHRAGLRLWVQGTESGCVQKRLLLRYNRT